MGILRFESWGRFAVSDIREHFLFFKLPISPDTPAKDAEDTVYTLLRGNSRMLTAGKVPAAIWLYDGEDRLTETRENVIRSRAAEATAE